MKAGFYYGKHKCKNVQHDSIIVDGIEFSLAPDAIEVEEYRGTKIMREYLRDLGYKYIRVQSGRHTFVFTDTPKLFN